MSENSNKTNRSLSPSTLRVGRRYRANRLDGPYDAIVIGSGMGGLTTAASLSKMGQKVLVLEQHYTAGGFTHAYARNGYEWDVGVHYIGDVGYPTITRKLFDFVSGKNLKWAAMDDNYDRIFLGSDEYNFIKGKKNFIAELKKAFPNEIDGIDRYMTLVQKVNKAIRWFTVGKLLRPWQHRIFKVLMSPFIPNYSNQTTYQVLSSITNNEKLIAVLSAQWGDYGVPPKQSSFMMHCLVAKHYINGGYYPVGGASEIAKSIIPQIQASGGEVFTYARVQNILVENGKAVGVLMQDGERIEAPLTISNTGVFNTFNRLLPERVNTSYQKKLKFLSPSFANVGLFIGLKHTAAELNLPKTNFWIYPDEHHDKNCENFLNDPSHPLPVVYVSFPSAKDPSFNARYPGRSTIEIVAPANYELFQPWKRTIWGKRGEDYEIKRAEYAERMLETLYQKLPQLRGKIDYYETSTPLTTEFFCNYDQGEMYGITHDPQRFEQSWLQPRTTLPGLWLTGQDTLSCGVAGAMVAGFLTSLNILGLRKGIKLTKMVLAETPPPKEGWVVHDQTS